MELMQKRLQFTGGFLPREWSIHLELGNVYTSDKSLFLGQSHECSLV